MYKNLKAEMIRQNVSIETISNALHIQKETARRKICGVLNISLNDCKIIAQLFSTNNSIDYLFKT